MGANFFFFNLQIIAIATSFVFALISIIQVSMPKNFKWLVLYNALAFLAATISFVEFHFLGYRYAALLLNFSLIFQLLIFGSFVLSLLKKNHLKKILLISFIIALVILVAIIFNSDITWMNYKAYSFSDLCITTFSIFYFLQLFKEPPVRKLSESPDFWFITGMFIGMGINTPLAAFIDYFNVNRLIVNGEFFLLIMTNGYLIMHLFFIKAYICLMKFKVT